VVALFNFVRAGASVELYFTIEDSSFDIAFTGSIGKILLLSKVISVFKYESTEKFCTACWFAYFLIIISIFGMRLHKTSVDSSHIN
jgi:hypothetical protein